jgi:hypothetical protein
MTRLSRISKHPYLPNLHLNHIQYSYARTVFQFTITCELKKKNAPTGVETVRSTTKKPEAHLVKGLLRINSQLQPHASVPHTKPPGNV